MSYVVLNGTQELEFDGDLLGHATTERDSSLRWTEIDIYKTKGNNYVVVRLGLSVVYHTEDSECTSTGFATKGYLIPETSEPCDRCNPRVPEDDDFDDQEVFIHEKSFSSAEVIEDASKVESALTMYDKHRKVLRVPSVASDALHQAASRDPNLLNKIITRVHVP